MTANDHAKILGIIFLVFGGLGILAIVGILVFLLGMGGIALFTTAGSGESIPILVIMLVFGAIIIIAGLFILPQIIAGWSLLKGRGDSKILIIISAIINVLNFPFGTAIGIYAFWFVFGEFGNKYFQNNQ